MFVSAGSGFVSQNPFLPGYPAYAFVDGGYLEVAFREALSPLYGGALEPDLNQVRLALQVLKLFYYDALYEPTSGESKDVLEATEVKASFLSGINEVDGVHVRTGSAVRRTGRNKKGLEQKEVDVLLAVECLTHAYRGNCPSVVLVTGDLDFRPLIDALIHAGIYVTLYSGPRGAKELSLAADRRNVLDYNTLYNWSSSKWKMANPDVHRCQRYRSAYEHYAFLDKQTFGKFGVKFFDDTHHSNPERRFYAEIDGLEHAYQCANEEVLRRFTNLGCTKGAPWISAISVAD
ncbi:MAG: NYN domain-containing protein [Fimbriimonadales bacterium]|nr:NYN domain-containing protein [Fimbriimonadales bacterium]